MNLSTMAGRFVQFSADFSWVPKGKTLVIGGDGYGPETSGCFIWGNVVCLCLRDIERLAPLRPLCIICIHCFEKLKPAEVPRS